MTRSITRIFQFAPLALLAPLAAISTGCLEPGTGGFNPSKLSTTSTSTIPSGVMAVQVIFNTSTGSFAPAPSGGTAAGDGSGLAAVKLFKTDGTTVLANGTTDANWPAWLSSVELGVTGSNSKYTVAFGGGGTFSSNTNCARFTTTAEASATNCNFGSGAAGCDAPAGGFRVSEVDCDYGFDPAGQGSESGNGSAGDNVYVRAKFNRSSLGSQENVLVVVNYAASSFHAPSANPSTCFTNGNFAPENCSDFTWKVFLRSSPTEVPTNPFMIFLPPTTSYVANNSKASGATMATKQFIIPLASNPTVNTLQLSRVTKVPVDPAPYNLPLQDSDATFTSACDVGGTHTSTGGNSPLCAGVVFYSMTFYRI